MSFHTQQDPPPDWPTRPGSTRRSLLPARSANDRKLAGVAGGLGRALGIDPVLIRVAFVVLAVFGGAGVLLYCLGWLLMPGDGDEVSAVEALAGRGRSSVSTGLTVVLIIVGLSSAGSVFSWGLPFWPVLIAAVVVFALIRHGRIRSGRPRAPWGGRAAGWGDRANDWGVRAGDWANGWANRVGEWGDRVGGRMGGGDGRRGGWASSETDSASPAGSASPFARPAFWDRAATPGQQPGAAGPGDPDGSAAPGDDAAAGGGSADGTGPLPPSPEDLLTRGRTTPPSWDPLGVAPFAWDLPDPTPEPAARAAAPSRGGNAVGRVFLGLALVTGGLLAGGVFAGWWSLSWAAVAGITLGVLGLGLLISSLRGSGSRGLIGPGVFLSLVTLALAVTGITGTAGYGQQAWHPKAVANVQDSYTWNAGDATLDLTGLTIGKGQTVHTDLVVRGGQATILVPAGVTVDATCSTGAGQVDCLGTQGQGLRTEVTGHQAGGPDSGTLTIEVRSNAGHAQVITHG